MDIFIFAFCCLAVGFMCGAIYQLRDNNKGIPECKYSKVVIHGNFSNLVANKYTYRNVKSFQLLPTDYSIVQMVIIEYYKHGKLHKETYHAEISKIDKTY